MTFTQPLLVAIAPARAQRVKARKTSFLFSSAGTSTHPPAIHSAAISAGFSLLALYRHRLRAGFSRFSAPHFQLSPLRPLCFLTPPSQLRFQLIFDGMPGQARLRFVFRHAFARFEMSFLFLRSALCFVITAAAFFTLLAIIR